MQRTESPVTESNPAAFDYRTITLSQGVVRYREAGPADGPTLVFIHGLLVNSALWRDVMALLADEYHCIAPDLPLGAHTIPLAPDADVTPRGVAALIAEFLITLNLTNVTLVGNDTGGALSQLVITQHPERIGRLVLTNCDAYEAFFPPLIRPFTWGAAVFGERFASALAWLFHGRPAQRLLLWTVAHRRVDEATLDNYFLPLSRHAGVRRDVTKFMRAVSSRDTLEAAQRFGFFTQPVLLVWGRDDFIFSTRNARRLQRDFPDAQVEFISHARAFVPEDQPTALAERIANFVAATDHD